MPRRIDDFHRPSLAPSAADLGMEAYQANLQDEKGPDRNSRQETAGIVPQWKAPQPHNSPPGQYRENAQEIKIGQDWKVHDNKE